MLAKLFTNLVPFWILNPVCRDRIFFAEMPALEEEQELSAHIKILLKQHIGAPCLPVVKKGGLVRKGTLIASASGLGADIHASVSGKIADVTSDYIEIARDASQPEAFEPIPDTGGIVDKVRAAGLVGMGGAGFPTHVKLGTNLNGGVVIANAVECEPLLKHNIRQITENPEKIRQGMLLAMQATSAGRGIFAIKSKNQGAMAAFRGVLQKSDNINISERPDLYPMGEERAIIRETLGGMLGTDQLPSAAGAVILNAETLSRIAEAVLELRPVISKNLTVVGKLKSGRESVTFMDVPIGTPVRELIDRAGGIDDSSPVGEIIMGGPFTGKSTSLDGVVTKTTGGIIVTMEFLREKRPLGLLVCACGANEERLREIAAKMGAQVVSVQKCKQAAESRGALKCENPGNCPGQAEKIMELKKSGAQAILCSNCSDCTNTVMCVAPKLKMPVYHSTDHVMRTVGHALVRRLPISA
jgi:proline reductase-associated electron transfer protein PrdC